MSGHRVQFADLPRSNHKGSPKFHKQTKSNLKVTSSQDAEHIGRKQASPNGTPPSRDTKGNRTVPRRHTLGGARGSREILAMQPSDMDKKREAFLEHLKQKYPHHASAIMGHQERLREQSRSPKHSPNLQHSIGDQVDHLSLASLESLDAMSETEAPAAFTRGSRVRASLPVVRSSNQTKDRSLGVLYLQYGDETKQIRMPNEITGIDTVRALFVGAFPQQLTMKMLESPSVAVYVKDDMRNMYYELTDVRNITDHSCLKVYHKDPAQAFSHGPRPANSDVRMHNEMVQASRNGQPPLRQPPMVPPTHHPIQGALSPSTQSMPSSPSRIPYGSRQGSLPSSATMPRERISTANPPARSISPCPSAILERRDVKPDEDTVGKSHSLARGNEGLYADPYLIQETRLSMASAHGPHPSLGLDGPEHVLGGFHRASIRSASSYGGPSPTDTMDHASLYRQKTRNSQLPTLGSKTPPPSPHRMTEVRIIDIHGIPPQGVPIERSSPVRQSFRKEEMTGTKPRNNMGSPVIPDLQGPIPPAGDQTRERMKAMEQQIASLTGLVQHALLKAPNTSGAKEPLSERPPKTSSPAHSAHTSGGSPVLAPKSSAAPSEKGSVPLKVNLLQFRKNVSDLRMQLHQMRQLQLQNQEALRIQLERAEQEISVKLGEAMRRLEDPVQRQRTVVEEDRNKYLVLEEFVLQQLSELEQYVGSLQKDSAATHRVVTLKDVEEGAVTLRKVGESLAGLKGEFPNLQTRMRAVLRVEVEAVKFLKEEPHKLDSMLKRVKSLTDTLSSLRRCATEGPQKGPDPCAYVPVDGPSSEALAEAPLASVQLGSTSGQLEPQSSTIRSEVMPSSPVVIHHIQSFPVHIQQSQQSAALTAQPSPPLTPSPTQVPSPKPTKRQDQESLNTGASDPPGPICHKKAHENPVNNINSSTNQNLVIEELQSSQDKSKQRAMSIEAVEKEWQERRQNMDHYDGKEFEKILQEAQANMMKGIPCLEIEESPALPPAASVEQANLVESPSEESQSELHADKPVIKGPEKLPQPVVEKPTKSSKTAIKPVPIDTVTKQMFEKPIKSPPPPPPPRKTYSTSGSGITTTRSGEVVYTSRKESVSAQDGEEEVPPSTPQAKSSKIPPEIKPKPATPPPVTACVTREEEDEGDKIMAELQSSEPCQEDKDPDTDENGNTTVRQSQGVIYYVTGQIHKDHPSLSGREEIPEHREPTQSPTQVSNVNLNENSPSQENQQPPQSPSPKSPTLATPPPISPKPVGLNGFKLPKKQMKRSESLKSSAEMEKRKFLNKINLEKKTKIIQEHGSSSSKNKIPGPITTTITSTIREAPTSFVAPPKKASSEDSDPHKAISEEDDEGGASLSPDLPGEEPPPPPDNIAFMITNTKVQALSCGEYRELVNAKKGSVQTVTVGGAANQGSNPAGSMGPLDNDFNKKPVIIIFDEPMDIRSAYKRLSTIFESEEELERMLAQECIEEESEESDTERRAGGTEMVDGKKVNSSQGTTDRGSLSSSSSSSISELADSGMNLESNGDAKQDSKKKFKFKFPKKQLAALTKAIRTGTKSGKKTLQVVVYEDEEESDGTVKQHKEAKRFEIECSKSLGDTPMEMDTPTLKQQNSDSLCRTNEIRKNTYKTLDSLEQTIKQLETTISEMGPPSLEDPVSTEQAKHGNDKSSEGAGIKRSSSLPTSRGSASKVPGTNSSQKKTKPQLLPRPLIIPPTSTATTVPSAPSNVQQVSL